MKRKSILILVAAMMLAVSIPMFALAQSDTAVQALDGTGNMYGQSNAASQGSRLQAQDCDGTEDCDCDAEGLGLGNDGEALHQYAGTGHGMMLNGRDTENENCVYRSGTAAAGQTGRSTSTRGGHGRSLGE